MCGGQRKRRESTCFIESDRFKSRLHYLLTPCDLPQVPRYWDVPLTVLLLKSASVVLLSWMQEYVTLPHLWTFCVGVAQRVIISWWLKSQLSYFFLGGALLEPFAEVPMARDTGGAVACPTSTVFQRRHLFMIIPWIREHSSKRRHEGPGSLFPGSNPWSDLFFNSCCSSVYSSEKWNS